MTTELLENEIKDFSVIYSDDVDSAALFSEICHLKQIHTSNISPSNDVMKPLTLLNKIAESNLTILFPNVCVVLRIFLTIPVTVATGERSFSKLSLVKNKLRNSSTQERVVSLSSLSIESELARTIDFTKIIDTFANMKARKVPLHV